MCTIINNQCDKTAETLQIIKKSPRVSCLVHWNPSAWCIHCKIGQVGLANSSFIFSRNTSYLIWILYCDKIRQVFTLILGCLHTILHCSWFLPSEMRRIWVAKSFLNSFCAEYLFPEVQKLAPVDFLTREFIGQCHEQNFKHQSDLFSQKFV